MDARREQILARITAVLLGATSAGDRVFRARVVPLGKEQATAIAVIYDGEQSATVGSSLSVGMTVKLCIYARGDPWDQLASVVDVEMHKALYRDAPLAALLSGLSRISALPDAEDADRTAGVLAVRYVARFLTRADDISLLPV